MQLKLLNIIEKDVFEVRKCLRYGDIFVQKKKMILSPSQLFINGKENRGQTKMDIGYGKLFVNKGIFGKIFVMAMTG